MDFKGLGEIFLKDVVIINSSLKDNYKYIIRLW